MVNISVQGVSRFSYNILFRRRQAVVLVVAFAFILYLLVTLDQLSRHGRDQKFHRDHLDIIQKRNEFDNPIYANPHTKLVPGDVGANCMRYFQEFNKLRRSHSNYIRSQESLTDLLLGLNDIHSFQFDRLVYLKRKFLRERIREWKISHKGEKIDPSIHEQIEEEFRELSQNTSNYERKMVLAFSHMRVWGKCNLDVEQHTLKQDQLYTQYEKELYPWISSKLPTFESWNGERLEEGQIPIYEERPIVITPKSFFKDLKEKSNGKGIVIPIYHHKSNEKRNKSIDNVRRLIRVLRGLNNTLPVQLIYSASDLNPHEKKQIVEIARGDITSLPKSYGELLDSTSDEGSEKVRNQLLFPKQDLSFANIDNSLDYNNYPVIRDSDIYNSSNFRYAMSAIFNSFEEFVLLDSHTIPLIEDVVKVLFQDERYRETGIIIYKGPTPYSSKLLRFKPGFHEINDLVKSLLMPSLQDSKYFGIYQRRPNPATDRVLQDHFQSLIDPSLLVINKSKVLNGLLIGTNVLLHKLLNTRFFPASLLHLRDDLNPEFIWLGQEMAGTFETINFSVNYAASVGTLTPAQNIPPKTVTMAHELCSASWAQVDESDKTKIIFVTSHQLDNWKENDHEFKMSFRDKFTIEGSDFGSLTEDQKPAARKMNAFYEENLSKNALHIETVMLPPTIKEPYYETEYREPNEAWILQNNFGSAKSHHYWCTYDIVGNPIVGARGVMLDLNRGRKAKYRFLLDLWIETEKF